MYLKILAHAHWTRTLDAQTSFSFFMFSQEKRLADKKRLDEERRKVYNSYFYVASSSRYTLC